MPGNNQYPDYIQIEKYILNAALEPYKHRLIVEKAMSFKPIRLERKRGAWKPPYWLVKNWDDIVIPYFGKEGSGVNSN